MQPGTRLRSTNDGQLGFFAQDEDGEWVNLDRGPVRPGQPLQRTPYHPSEWVADERPKLNRIQRAQVAYAADRALREVLGEYSVPEWRMLEENKGRYIDGPKASANPARVALWASVLKGLEQF